MPKKPKFPSEGEELLGIADICRWFGIDQRTLHRWVKDGQFPQPIVIGPIKLGNSARRWPRKEVEEWLEARPRDNKTKSKDAS